jgi:hypothetical protein
MVSISMSSLVKKAPVACHQLGEPLGVQAGEPEEFAE